MRFLENDTCSLDKGSTSALYKLEWKFNYQKKHFIEKTR